MDAVIEKALLAILREELVPAQGCTEPIAVAYAAAKAREVLGEMPEQVIVRCSGNLLKNIRCVVVPNTGDLVGVEASALAGIVGGSSDRKLEVLSGLDAIHLEQIKTLLQQKICQVELLKTDQNLHLVIRLEHGDKSSEVEICDTHTNIIRIEKDGQILFSKPREKKNPKTNATDSKSLSVDKIVGFANDVDLDKISPIIEPQITHNMKIAIRGLNADCGVSIGKAILKNNPSLYGKMKAYAAAASEARMCGSTLPVIINSGSGNQGIAASVPVIVYAEEKRIPETQLIRALALSNLLTIYQKCFIGRLSAFCGAVSACAAAGAALTYLDGGDVEQIKMTLVNSLADVSGIICDGAKASCAAKIATGLDASFISHFLALERKCYNPLTGILGKDADATICSVGKMATDGMKDTDRVILDIILEK